MKEFPVRSLGLGLALAVIGTLSTTAVQAQKKPPLRELRQAPLSGPVTLTAVPEAPRAGAAPKSRVQLRAELEITYRDLKVDPKFHALEQKLAGNMENRAVVDEYLRFMPISPLEFLEIDMRTRRYEVSIPRYLFEWHLRWIALHEATARAFYGDDYVDSVLAGVPVETEGDAGDGAGLATRASVGTNRNVASTFSPAPETFQGEIQLAVNPNNANQIVAAANTWDTIGGTCGGGIQAVFYSSDGGANWGYTCPPGASAYGMSCAGTVFGSDPAVYWNDNNEVFLNHMLLCAIGSQTQFAMVVARSANGGATWNGQGVIRNSWGTTTLEDKNFYVIDNNASSPFHGRHYTCWDRSNNEKSAHSSNNGVSWTEVDLPTPSGGGFDLGCDLAVEDSGTVHVVFDTLTCGANCTNERMFYTRSTNGGLSWSTPVLVRDFNLVAFSTNSNPDAQDNRGIGPFGAVDVDNSGGACDGTLYAAFGDTATSSASSNTADVYVSRSTNGGSTWSTPVKVNDDGLSNSIQFHPFVVVDQSNGQVVVAWHDARNDAGNDAVEIFTARSTDCGQSFQANVKVAAPSSEFNNSTISFSDMNTADNPNANPNQYGEYLGLDAQNCKAYVSWTDTRHYFPSFTSESQEENLGFAVVDFECGPGPVCGDNVAQAPEVCDGTDLNGQTCVSQGFSGGGTLACNGTCNGFDTSGCIGGPVCGNGVIETGEQCDGGSLGGATCTSLGFSGGTLACSGSCTYDTSGCTTGGCTTQTLYSNNFDAASGLAGWSRGSFNGSNVNVWRGVQTCSAASSPRIFRFGGTGCTSNYSSSRFIFAQPNGSTGIAVPAGSSGATLTFAHRRQFETGYDGALVALSLDNSSYTVVPASAIVSGATYNGTVNAACEPAGSAGLPIFTGTQSSFVSTGIDLDAACNIVTGGTGGCAGQTLYIAFTGITDCSVTADGWFLDNVVVSACVP
jgi:hypothetical protein